MKRTEIGFCSGVILVRYVVFSFLLPYWTRRRRYGRLIGDYGLPVVDFVHGNIWNRLVSITRAKLKMRAMRGNNCSLILPILLTGPTGNGKTVLGRRLARQFDMKCIEMDCFSLWSEVAGTAEAKLRNIFTQAVNSAPCVLILKRVDIIGKDASMDEYDIRVITCLKDLLTSHSLVSNQPMLVIGTALKSDQLCVNLASIFLYRFTVETWEEKERWSFIIQRFRCHEETKFLSEGPEELKSVVQKTAGYTIADVERVVETARYLAVIRNGGFRMSAASDDRTLGVEWQDVEAALSIDRAKMSDAIGAPKIPDVRWEDVGGLANVKQALLESIRMYIDCPELAEIGMRRSGVLLYGPPGCGKTLVAKAVANECGLNFLSVKGPELLNMYVGQSEQNIREIFERARSASPCIIFFDELDALAPNRGRSGDSGGVMDRVVSQLLAEMDGLQKRGDIFVIGATNRVDLIDPSLMRPGRFDKTIYVGIGGDFASRLNVFNAVTRRLTLADDVNREEIIGQCPDGMSGADFYALAAEAAINAAQRKVDEIRVLWRERTEEDDDIESEPEEEEYQVIVDQNDFLIALGQLKPSISAGEMGQYRGLKQL